MVFNVKLDTLYNLYHIKASRSIEVIKSFQNTLNKYVNIGSSDKLMRGNKNTGKRASGLSPKQSKKENGVCIQEIHGKIWNQGIQYPTKRQHTKPEK